VGAERTQRVESGGGICRKSVAISEERHFSAIYEEGRKENVGGVETRASAIDPREKKQ